MPTENRRVATYLPKELDDRLKAFIVERNLKGDSPALIVILSEYFGVDTLVAQKVDYSSFVRTEQFQELAAKVSELATVVEKSNSPSTLLSNLPNKIKRLEERIDSLESLTKQPTVDQIAVDEASMEIVNDGSSPGQIDLLSFKEGDIQSEDAESLQISSSGRKVEGLQTNGLASESLSNTSSELKSGLFPSSIDDSPSSSLGVLIPLKATALSRRFRLHDKTVTNQRLLFKSDPEKFTEWAKKKDPNGIAWRYDLEDKLYHPIVNSSPISLSGGFRSSQGRDDRSGVANP